MQENAKKMHISKLKQGKTSFILKTKNGMKINE